MAAGNLLTPYFSVFQDQLALRGFTHGGGSSSVAIDLTKMKTAGGRTQSIWSFPPPANNVEAPVNYFVGENTVQTLTNKALTAVPSIEFTPPSAGSWGGVNSETIPNSWSPARGSASGSTSLNFYEQLSFRLRLIGHMGSESSTSGVAWVQVYLTRVGNLVTMQTGEYVVNSGARPAGTISSHPDTPIPARFRPGQQTHHVVWVIDNGVGKFGSLIVIPSTGTLRFTTGPNLQDPFAATSGTSGIMRTAVSWISL
jgi:hypothetical protein